MTVPASATWVEVSTTPEQLSTQSTFFVSSMCMSCASPSPVALSRKVTLATLATSGATSLTTQSGSAMPCAVIFLLSRLLAPAGPALAAVSLDCERRLRHDAKLLHVRCNAGDVLHDEVSQQSELQSPGRSKATCTLLRVAVLSDVLGAAIVASRPGHGLKAPPGKFTAHHLVKQRSPTGFFSRRRGPTCPTGQLCPSAGLVGWLGPQRGGGVVVWTAHSAGMSPRLRTRHDVSDKSFLWWQVPRRSGGHNTLPGTHDCHGGVVWGVTGDARQVPLPRPLPSEPVLNRAGSIHSPVFTVFGGTRGRGGWFHPP